MTLDEAIKHTEEVVKEQEELANKFKSLKDFGNTKSSITYGYEKSKKRADEYSQLAEWLKELKQLRGQTRWIPMSEGLPEERGLEEQKTGKWIPHEYGGFYCSKCKSDTFDEVDGNYIHFPARTKYCHNCGARMEEA